MKPTIAPRILPRPEHTLSRKNIEKDALKVLYRLKTQGFKAYLVGGGVRDMLLGRRPKDFDIATDAHPQQIKKLFYNCFIIGRRFRLCHVRFGRKVVEVSTFRRQAEPEEGDTLIRRDNTFGTPEEDAFRRDFTVNALIYDIASFAIIDYVGGLEDLHARVIRTIGDPALRFREDPVRMLRAVALAARLGFTIDRDTLEAIQALRGEIVKSSPPRLLEEVYKILRQGAARRTFESLHEVGLLAYLLPEASRRMRVIGPDWLASLSRLDDYRNNSLGAIEELSNPLLLGSLIVPLGVPPRSLSARIRTRPHGGEGPAEPATSPEPRDDVASELKQLGTLEPAADGVESPSPIPLPFSRRDLDRLRLILAAQPRLREVQRSPAAKHALASRTYFPEALRWLEIHGDQTDQELVLHWRSLDVGDLAPPQEGLSAGHNPSEPDLPAPAPEHAGRGRRRPFRRRRRRRRPTPPPATQS